MKQIKTYARYIFKDATARLIGNGWHEITEEKSKYFPSGRHIVVIINGYAIKASHCEIVQVIC